MEKLKLIVHTPEPWTIEGDINNNNASGVVIRGDGVWIATIHNDHYTKGERPTDGFPGNREGLANAHLMFTAPKMLRKLKAYIGVCKDDKELIKIIAEAEGGSHE